jgi:TATA-binding protein-associated factor Taf7
MNTAELESLIAKVDEVARLKSEWNSAAFANAAYAFDWQSLSAELVRLKDERDHAIECMETPPTKAEMQRELVRLREENNALGTTLANMRRDLEHDAKINGRSRFAPYIMQIDAAIDRARKEKARE